FAISPSVRADVHETFRRVGQLIAPGPTRRATPASNTVNAPQPGPFTQGGATVGTPVLSDRAGNHHAHHGHQGLSGDAHGVKGDHGSNGHHGSNNDHGPKGPPASNGDHGHHGNHGHHGHHGVNGSNGGHGSADAAISRSAPRRAEATVS